MALLASAAKTALRRAAGSLPQHAGVGGQRRGLSWVKDVTVNVTFVNHEVRACLLLAGSCVDQLLGPRLLK